MVVIGPTFQQLAGSLDVTCLIAANIQLVAIINSHVQWIAELDHRICRFD